MDLDEEILASSTGRQIAVAKLLRIRQQLDTIYGLPTIRRVKNLMSTGMDWSARTKAFTIIRNKM